MATTQAAAVHTHLTSSREAGLALGAAIQQQLSGQIPHVIILFASPGHDYSALLDALHEQCTPELLVGCSSAGEFSGTGAGTFSASALALHATDMHFNAILAPGLRENRTGVLAQLSTVFTADKHPEYQYHSALVLTDALAGFADELVHDLTILSAGSYQLFGGGAADDDRFDTTHLFLGRQTAKDAVVILEILSKRKLGLGVQHGWLPASGAMRVTEIEDNRLISLNATRAIEIFQHHAQSTGQVFNMFDPLPFFLHNVLGVQCGDGYKLRVPLAIDSQGAIVCASEIPLGATVYIMRASVESSVEAARLASAMAVAGLNGAPLAGSLVFDCAATRMRLGREFADELAAVTHVLGSDKFAGCNTYGQIARAEGQFNGFHNCTAIVCAIPA